MISRLIILAVTGLIIDFSSGLLTTSSKRYTLNIWDHLYNNTAEDEKIFHHKLNASAQLWLSQTGANSFRVEIRNITFLEKQNIVRENLPKLFQWKNRKEIENRFDINYYSESFFAVVSSKGERSSSSVTPFLRRIAQLIIYAKYISDELKNDSENFLPSSYLSSFYGRCDSDIKGVSSTETNRFIKIVIDVKNCANKDEESLQVSADDVEVMNFVFGSVDKEMNLVRDRVEFRQNGSRRDFGLSISLNL